MKENYIKYLSVTIVTIVSLFFTFTTLANQSGPIQANNEFGFKVYQKLLDKKSSSGERSENTFYSPISTYIAFSMLLNGSNHGSDTESVLKRVMELGDVDLTSLNRANHDLLNSLQRDLVAYDKDNEMHTSHDGGKTWNPPFSDGDEPKIDFQLSLANSIWATNQVRVKPSYQSNLEEYYQAQFDSRFDFLTQTAQATAEINKWVNNATNEKIPSIVNERTVKDLIMALINATYLKAGWTIPFYKHTTHNENFYQEGPNGLDRTKFKVVDMMQRSGEKFKVVDNDKYRAIELPLGSNERASVYVMLPKGDKTKLAEVENQVKNNWSNLEGQFNQATYTTVDLKLPKFKVEADVPLKELLTGNKGLGMDLVFSDDAELHEMAEAVVPDASDDKTVSLRVSDAFQKTYIKVDEEGLEAAAVTFIGATITTSLPDYEPPILFYVDRPFHLVIVDNSTGAILFIGSIVNP